MEIYLPVNKYCIQTEAPRASEQLTELTTIKTKFLYYTESVSVYYTNFKGATSPFVYLEKMAKLFEIVNSSSFLSSPSSIIILPFCFRITPFGVFLP